MPLRSLLFTPATRLDRLERALSSGADLVALDLEDGVGPGDKDAARAALADLAASGFAGAAERIAVRINPPWLPDGVRDLASMLDWPAWPGTVVLPKVESPAQAAQFASLAPARAPAPALVLSIETAAGVAGADAVALAAPAGAALAYGSADHMAETGGTMSGPALAHGRGRVVNAAAAAGMPALDGAWLDFRDADGLRAEAALARSIGFAGKIAIHPDQVEPINAAFSPTAEEAARARELLAAAEAAGGGAFAHEGRMVDAPVLARARLIAGEREERG